MKPKLKEHTKLLVPANPVTVPIYIGNGIVDEIPSVVPLKNFSKVGILMDKNVAYYWGEEMHRIFGEEVAFFVIPAGEEYKELHTVEKILTSMLENGFDRKSLLINVGGGMVCDIGGFAASVYMRGISFVNVPTTLLAQTDAAIGGKTGVDFGGLKNMVGTFSNPLAVICDTLMLSTLPERDFRSGFAEVIKHALIYDKKLFTKLASAHFGAMDEDELANILSASCEIKCEIVSKDSNEKGLRKILNFGHTVGHAIEMISQDTAEPLLHGEAISIGMIAEARLSLLAGLITKEDFAQIEKILNKANLPVGVPKSYKKRIYEKMLGDKKNESRKIKWVLLKGVGKAVIDEEHPEKLINKAIDYILE